MDNSASRLLFILEKCKEVDKKLSCAQAWKQVLDVSSEGELMGAIGDFMKLAEQAGKEIMTDHPDESDAVRYWQRKILSGFGSASLSVSWDNFSNHIDNVSIFSIRSQSKILNSSSNKKKIDAEEISKIIDLFQSSLDLCAELKISKNAKKAICSRIEQIISLLNRYQYVGQDALLDATKLLVADISLLPKNEKDEVFNSSTYSKVKEAAENLAHATTIVFENPMITAAGTSLLNFLKQ